MISFYTTQYSTMPHYITACYSVPCCTALNHNIIAINKNLLRSRFEMITFRCSRILVCCPPNDAMMPVEGSSGRNRSYTPTVLGLPPFSNNHRQQPPRLMFDLRCLVQTASWDRYRVPALCRPLRILATTPREQRVHHRGSCILSKFLLPIMRKELYSRTD